MKKKTYSRASISKVDDIVANRSCRKRKRAKTRVYAEIGGSRA